MYSMRLIHWKKGKKKKKKNYVYGLNMHVHVSGLMYLFIHLSFINVRLAMMLPQILLLSFLSLVHPLLQQYWLFLSHLSTDGHVPAPEKKFNIILQLLVKLEYHSLFYFYSKWYFSWGKCWQFLTLILSVRLASLPTHTNRTTPVSKMNASPWFMEDQPICV